MQVHALFFNANILQLYDPIYLLMMFWSRLSSSCSLRASLWSSLLSLSFLLKCCLFIHISFLLTVIGLLFRPSKLNCSTSSLRENSSWGLIWAVVTAFLLSPCVTVVSWSELEWWVGGVQPRRAMKLTTASGRYPFSCSETLPLYGDYFLSGTMFDISADWPKFCTHKH